MEQIDEYIQNIVTQRISEPENLDEIIMNAISFAKEKKKDRLSKIKKIILAFILLTIFLSSICIILYIR